MTINPEYSQAGVEAKLFRERGGRTGRISLTLPASQKAERMERKQEDEEILLASALRGRTVVLHGIDDGKRRFAKYP